MTVLAFMSSGPGLGGLLISLLIAIGLFFLMRSIMLWYWKVDTIIKNQNEQKYLLTQQNDLLEKLYYLQGGQKPKNTNDTPEEIARKAKRFDESKGK